MRRLSLPQEEEAAVPWDFFLLEAALGSARVPQTVFRAVRPVVGLRLGQRTEAVGEAELERALAKLPVDPSAWLAELLGRLELVVPAPGAPRRLGDGPVRPASPLSQLDLLHDAACDFQRDYGRDGFYAAFEAVDQDGGCARAAVVMALYLLVLQAV